MSKNTSKNYKANKLLPAVAMLTVSAISLSTATYAWFTMNKEVEVKGLSMTATAADSLEVSLAKVAKTNNTITKNATRPADTTDEISWTQSITVGEYYEEICKIKPSSSLDAINFFDAQKVSNGGMLGSNFTKLTNDSSKAYFNFRDALTTGGVLSTADEVAGTKSNGYFIDIPVHLRTSKLSPNTMTNTAVFCKMTIQDNDATTPPANGDLYKAVRVAFIPIKEDGEIDTTTTAASSVWLADDEKKYYNNGPVTAATTPTYATSLTNYIVSGDTAADTKMTIPYATNTSGTVVYGHTDFIVRIWLEGESEYCQDLNASQNWQIDMKFALSAVDFT